MITEELIKEAFIQAIDELEEERYLREAEEELASLTEEQYQQKYGAIGDAILRWVKEDTPAPSPQGIDWRRLTSGFLTELQGLLMPLDLAPALRFRGQQQTLAETLEAEGLADIPKRSGWMLAQRPVSRNGRTSFLLVSDAGTADAPRLRILDTTETEIPPSGSNLQDIGRPACEILIDREIDTNAGIDIALAEDGTLLLRVTPKET
ncbi:MAG: hypothetical protein KJ558_08000 [Gammaproteobacteria bacterium]|nr:hypothetical protein [Gammaproteobacteria bacterium]MBU1654756.1 hypothetical protein [Gammaproteobacteria bacterium]MBU1961631.1 hypothetical protein [Gammaproteobacteria bacterium]